MQTADTNLFVRALVHDASAPEQCAAAVEWLTGLTAVYVPQLVQAEAVWWMRDALSRADTLAVLRGLLEHPAVHLQGRDAFESALEHFENGGDFADGLIVFEAARAGAPLVTFDKKLARKSDVSLLRIARPR